AVLDSIAREAAAFRDQPGPLRGETRKRITPRVAELDRLMLDAARVHADPAAVQAMRIEASTQLLPFRDRMAAETYGRAIDAAVDRLLRERDHLPVVAFG